MDMVFKIIGDFNDDTFDSLLSKISKHFVFLYVQDALFVAIKDFRFSERAHKYLKSILKPSKDFYISVIDEKNISKQNEIIKDWCLHNFVTLETQKYNELQQEKLRNVWRSMDAMEEELQKIKISSYEDTK